MRVNAGVARHARGLDERGAYLTLAARGSRPRVLIHNSFRFHTPAPHAAAAPAPPHYCLFTKTTRVRRSFRSALRRYSATMTLGVILLVILISLLLLLTVFHYATSGRKYWLNRHVPYKEPCPIFGNFGATFIMRRSYTRMLQIFYDSFRDEKYVGIYQARRPTLMLIDLELVKTIMSSEFPSFGDRISVSTDTKREPLLRNLANMSGAEWKTMRHIVTPTFSSAKMKAMFPLIAECTKSLKNALDRESGEDIDVPKLMTRYTTDVLGSCAFGVDPGSLKDERSPFLIMSQKMFKTDRATILKRYCRAFFPRLFKLLNLKTYSPEVEYFFSTTIKRVLDERRSTGKERSDFLQLMLNVQKNENGFAMTDELIVSNSFIFMLAGLETTATTMSFCLYHLAKDQELQDRIRSEVRECLERHNGMTYEAVCAMHLVIAVFYETLRMHPPTPLTTRLCTAPCTIPGTELSAKPRDAYLIPIHCIQKDATYFPDPDKFDPERFSNDLNHNGFLAFGEGPRSCPGARFAQLMFTAGLATILQHYAVEPCERTTPTIDYDTRSVMLKNKGGIWLKYRAHSESK